MSEPTIVLERVTLFYGEVIGLSSVDLELEPGITGVIGPNGSGKTTLMRLLTGLAEPVEGVIKVLNGSPFDEESIRARIAFVPATECFYPTISGRKNLEIAFLARGESRASARKLADKGLDIADLQKDGDRNYGHWSRGMRQRLKVGLALAIDADVILLDEPFLGVDVPNRRAIKKLVLGLKETEKTVIVSSHILHEVEDLTDENVILASGRVLGQGAIETLVADVMASQPRRIRIHADKRRLLARHLVERDDVLEVRFAGQHEVEVVTDAPDAMFKALPGIISEHDIVVRNMGTMGESLESVFEQVTAGGAQRL